MTGVADAMGGLADRFGLAPMDQVSFVVADLERSLPIYRGIFGEFRLQEVTFTPERVTYRGEPAEAALTLAFAHSGSMEIELVQVTAGRAPQQEHLARHGEGLHHVRFPVLDHDRTRADLEAAGFTTVLLGSSPTGTTFSYVEAPTLLGHALVELIEFGPDDPRRHRTAP